jgi:hypothetical protein
MQRILRRSQPSRSSNVPFTRANRNSSGSQMTFDLNSCSLAHPAQK